MWTKQQTVSGNAARTASSNLWEHQLFLSAHPRRRGSRNTAVRTLASLVSSLQIKGRSRVLEDLQIDGKVEGAISLRGHQLTVGSTRSAHSEIHASEVVRLWQSHRHLHAATASTLKRRLIVGDISTARISIEDGAHFKAASKSTQPNPKPPRLVTERPYA